MTPQYTLLREAAERATLGVAVKPLEWFGHEGRGAFGSYTVSENIDDRWEWTYHEYPYGSPSEVSYPSMGEAKAAAQADYEQRIRSALLPDPAILSLIADVEEMLRVLEPFARHYDLNDLAERDEDDALEIPVGDLRRASATLNKRSRQMTDCEPMTKEEFTARFKARMLAVAGEKFADGDSIAEYADMTAPTYWDEPSQREEGPEECADADVSYWGDE